METILTDTIKSSMRILSKSAVIEQDINNSIAACKLDLQLAGVVNINENDALIIRAVTLFVKAEFNYQNAADRYRQSYEALKMSLCLASTLITAAAFAQYFNIAMLWYYWVAAIALGFLVCYAAMFGYDNLYKQIMETVQKIRELLAGITKDAE